MFTKLKNSFASRAIAAGMVVAATISPAFANEAGKEAAEPPVAAENVQPAASVTQEIAVPIRDARGAQEDGIQMAAAIASKDAQVIVYFGNDYEAYKSIVRAAQDILAEDEIPLRGIILADPLEPEFVNGYQISTDQEIEFYANGHRTATILNPDADTKNDIKEQLERDYKRIIIPSRTLASAEDHLRND